jgi:hypothetical protein
MKITKSQLRRIIKEEVIKEFAGITGGRASHGDPYAADRAQRAKNPGTTSEEMSKEEIEAVVNPIMIKAFPDLTSLGHLSAGDRNGVLNIVTQGYWGDEETLEKNAEKFFAGQSTHFQAKTFFGNLKGYKRR